MQEIKKLIKKERTNERMENGRNKEREKSKKE